MNATMAPVHCLATAVISPLGTLGAAGWLPDAGALEGSGRAFKELIGQWIWLTAQD